MIVANPHVRGIHNALLFELKGATVINISPDVLGIAEHLPNGACAPGRTHCGADPGCVQTLGDLAFAEQIPREPVIDLKHLRHFVGWPRYQDHPIGLKALVLAPAQYPFDGTALVNEYTPEAKARRAPLSKPHLDESALSGKHLG